MEASFLVVAAAAGYYYCTQCIERKYLTAREDGQRLYLGALFYGLLFLIIAWVINYLSIQIPIWFDFSPIIIVSDDENEFSIAVMTVATAFGYTKFINSDQKKKLACLKHAWGRNDMDTVCAEAISRRRPVTISMDNRKVYVGMLADTLEPTRDNSHITILPIHSGHRDSENLEFSIDSTYFTVFKFLYELEEMHLTGMDIPEEKKQQLVDYYMVFPREKINSFHIYNDDLYQEVNGEG